MEYLYSDITSEVINSFYDVYNELGYGFLEKVYKNALFNELTQRGIQCQKEYPISVYYKGTCVGEYYADIIIEGKIIIELKAVKSILPEHLAQLTNYLRATEAEVGLLLNFGPEPQKKRVLFTNDKKILSNK
jgi:GxxExxY protein